MSGETPTINCDIFASRLMDVLEGDLDGASRAALEAHARQCRTCGPLLADLRAVSHLASQLPALTPSRDLWPGIADRIAAPTVVLAERRSIWKSPRLGALAAAAGLVLAAGLGYRALRHTPAVPATAAVHVAATSASLNDSAPAATPLPSTTRAPQALERAHTRLAADRAAEATPAAIEKSYDGEIAGLRTIIAQRHSQLDTATVAVLERNLAVIDSAIAQCKAALARDPHSRFLMQSLSQSLDIKVQLMRMTAGLPSAT